MFNNISWTIFLTRKGAITYADSHGNYYLARGSSPFICVLNKGGDDAADFETNYKNDSTERYI